MSSVLAFLAIRGQGLSRADRDLLAVGSALAITTGMPFRVALLGADVRSATTEAASVAERVFVVQHPALAEVETDICLAAIGRVLQADAPAVILFGSGVHEREMAARLAVRLDCAVVTNCASVQAIGEGAIEVVSPIFGGAAEAVYQVSLEQVSILAIRTAGPPAAQAAGGSMAQVVFLEVALEQEPGRIRLIERRSAPGPKLEEAKTIVAGGVGLLKRENFRYVEELAAVLGGMPAASRAIVDRGWATPAQQVGLTGRVVTPRLYLAIGISGATQHMAGCSAAEAIVAVNVDRTAPIMRYARYGVVADSLEFLPAFIEACRRVRLSSAGA